MGILLEWYAVILSLWYLKVLCEFPILLLVPLTLTWRICVKMTNHKWISIYWDVGFSNSTTVVSPDRNLHCWILLYDPRYWEDFYSRLPETFWRKDCFTKQNSFSFFLKHGPQGSLKPFYFFPYLKRSINFNIKENSI